jgi:fucose permease
MVNQLHKDVSLSNPGILSGIFQTGACLGAVVMTPVTGVLVDQIDIYLGVWFLTLSALLALVFLIRFVKGPQKIK